MINYQSSEPTNNWMKLDKNLIVDLSGDTLKLFIILMLLDSNEDNSNKNLMKLTGYGERKVLRCKNELIDKKYLDTKQLYGNRYAFYIGKESVRQYRASKYKKDNRHEFNQIKYM